ncbi:hypothetical protein O23A_p3127 [Aeromonas salmonicida]|nr:hypothetical protein O23A_p3127 [Aeromonas salmonicida]
MKKATSGSPFRHLRFLLPAPAGCFTAGWCRSSVTAALWHAPDIKNPAWAGF